jgi:predicted GNAT family acetyltransferase
MQRSGEKGTSVMITIRTYSDAAEFLAVAEDSLARDEAANNVIYGLARAMAADPSRAPERLYLATAHQNGELLYAAEMTPPWRLLISTTPASLTASDFAPLVEDLRMGAWQVSGVTAPARLAEQFAAAWAAHAGESYTVDIRMRLFELRAVRWPARPPGHFRAATLDDLPLLYQWYCDFSREAIPSDPPPAEGGVRRSIDDGNVFLWEDGKPVSFAARGRRLPHGASVGPVYTPREFRGRGYASACVAALSQWILDGGAQFCVLFTDLANPTSNHIYQALGYRPHGDYIEYNFYAAPAS